MTIQYVLCAFPFKKNKYFAQVKPVSALSLEDIVNRMLMQGSTITRADVKAVLELYFATIEDCVLDGHSVNLPMCNYSAKIKGEFDSIGEGFNHIKHTVVANTSPGTRFKKIIKSRAHIQKKYSLLPTPLPLDLTDFASKTKNQILTPGNLGHLVGSKLKIDETDPLQGVFLIAENNSEIRANTYAVNTAGKLTFLIPQLTPGEYRLEVRKRFRKSGIRNGKLDSSLTVVPSE